MYKRQVITSIDEQSPDIALGVDRALEYKEGAAADEKETGAGDQGMMFGLSLIHIWLTSSGDLMSVE